MTKKQSTKEIRSQNKDTLERIVSGVETLWHVTDSQPAFLKLTPKGDGFIPN